MHTLKPENIQVINKVGDNVKKNLVDVVFSIKQNSSFKCFFHTKLGYLEI